jgi:hypothetical protein
MFRDEEDDLPARPEDQYRSDKKEVQRKRKAESKGQLRRLERAMLRSKIDKNAVDAQQADEQEDQERRQSEDSTPPETFGTKTHMQEDQQEVQTADATPTDEQLIVQQEKHDAAKKQTGEEYQSEPG